MPEEEEGSGLVVELILSLPVHTESLLSILFASGETDEELICGSVVSFSLLFIMLFIISIYEKLAKDLENRFEVVPCSRPATSLKGNSFTCICKRFC